MLCPEKVVRSLYRGHTLVVCFPFHVSIITDSFGQIYGQNDGRPYDLFARAFGRVLGRRPGPKYIETELFWTVPGVRDHPGRRKAWPPSPFYR